MRTRRRSGKFLGVMDESGGLSDVPEFTNGPPDLSEILDQLPERFHKLMRFLAPRVSLNHLKGVMQLLLGPESVAAQDDPPPTPGTPLVGGKHVALDLDIGFRNRVVAALQDQADLRRYFCEAFDAKAMRSYRRAWPSASRIEVQ